MKNVNKIVKALAIVGLVSTSTISIAATVSGNLSFTTIADVKIVEDKALGFGDTVIPKLGLSCTIVYKGEDDGGDGSQELAGSTLTGDACGGSTYASANVSGGRFTVTGAQGQSIKITVKKFESADLKFTPSGNYVNAEHGVAGTSITLVEKDFFSDTLLTANLGQDIGAAATGAGTLYVGGKLEVLQDLDPGTRYPATYEIEVTY